ESIQDHDLTVIHQARRQISKLCLRHELGQGTCLVHGCAPLFALDSHAALHDICPYDARSSVEREHSMFEGFEQRQITTSGTTINLVKGGNGPGLLLLHGYPQTHAMWHKIAPRLAQDFTVVAPDLRGYGDSGKPPGDPEHLTYSKRAMAQDQA